jgi:hypothetical protein
VAGISAPTALDLDAPDFAETAERVARAWRFRGAFADDDMQREFLARIRR